MPSKLKSKNVTVNGRRTSMRLEVEMWTALSLISDREDTNINRICSRVEKLRGEASLTSAVRVFALLYFRRAAKIGDIGPEASGEVDYVFGRK